MEARGMDGMAAGTRSSLEIFLSPAEDQGRDSSSDGSMEYSAGPVNEQEPLKAPLEDQFELVYAPGEEEEKAASELDFGDYLLDLAEQLEPPEAPPEDSPVVAATSNLELFDAPDEVFTSDSRASSSADFGDVFLALSQQPEPCEAPPEECLQTCHPLLEAGLSSPMMPFKDTGGAASLLKDAIVASASLDVHEYSLSTSRQFDGSTGTQSFSVTGATMDSEQLQASARQQTLHDQELVPDTDAQNEDEQKRAGLHHVVHQEMSGIRATSSSFQPAGMELFDAGDDEYRAEAVAMLKRKPPNTCMESQELRMHAVPRPLVHRGVPKLPLKPPARGTPNSARGVQQGRSRTVSAAQSSGPSRVRSGSPSLPNRSRGNSLQTRSINASRGVGRHGSRSREASVESRSDISIPSARASSHATRVQNDNEPCRGRHPKQASKASAKAQPRGNSSEPREHALCANRAWASPSPDSRNSSSQCHQSHSTPSPVGACRSSVPVAPNAVPRTGSDHVRSRDHCQGGIGRNLRSTSLPPPRLPPVTSKKAKSTGGVHVMPKIEASRSRLRQHTGCTRARMEAIQKPATPKRFRQEFLGPIPGWRRS